MAASESVKIKQNFGFCVLSENMPCDTSPIPFFSTTSLFLSSKICFKVIEGHKCPSEGHFMVSYGYIGKKYYCPQIFIIFLYSGIKCVYVVHKYDYVY